MREEHRRGAPCQALVNGSPVPGPSRRRKRQPSVRPTRTVCAETRGPTIRRRLAAPHPIFFGGVSIIYVIDTHLWVVSGQWPRSAPLIETLRFGGLGGPLPVCHGSRRRRRKWVKRTSRSLRPRPSLRDVELAASTWRASRSRASGEGWRPPGARRAPLLVAVGEREFWTARRAPAHLRVQPGIVSRPALGVSARVASGSVPSQRAARQRRAGWGLARSPPGRPSLRHCAGGTEAAAGVERPSSPGSEMGWRCGRGTVVGSRRAGTLPGRSQAVGSIIAPPPFSPLEPPPGGSRETLSTLDAAPVTGGFRGGITGWGTEYSDPGAPISTTPIEEGVQSIRSDGRLCLYRKGYRIFGGVHRIRPKGYSVFVDNRTAGPVVHRPRVGGARRTVDARASRQHPAGGRLSQSCPAAVPVGSAVGARPPVLDVGTRAVEDQPAPWRLVAEGWPRGRDRL